MSARLFDRLGQVTLLLVALLAGTSAIGGWDIWWHLKTGELALERCSVLPFDEFSLTHQGDPWVYKDLGADIVFDLLYRLGGQWGLALFKLLITVACLWLLMVLVSQRSRVRWNVLLVAGIDHPSSEGGTAAEIVEQVKLAGATTVILCSSGKVYATQAIEVARALKDAGITKVLIAGRLKETGSDDAASLIDGEIFDGMDVAGFLASTLDELGVAK